MALTLGGAIIELIWAVVEFLAFDADRENWKERVLLYVLWGGLLSGVIWLTMFLYPRVPTWQLLLAGGAALVSGVWLLMLLSAWLLDTRIGDSWRHKG